MTKPLILNHTGSYAAPDIYFEQRYGANDARTSGGEWYCLATPDGSWLMPLVERQVGGARVAMSPYGYSGLYQSTSLEPSEAVRLWNAAGQLLLKRGVVSVFLRFHPLDPRSTRAAAAIPRLSVTRTSSTFAMEIADNDLMWSALEGRARTEVRKAERSGMTAEMAELSVGDVAGGAPFRRLYEGTMNRVEAANRYYFDDAYYAGLVAMGPEHTHLACVHHEGRVVAAAIIMRHGARAHYHLSGSDRGAARLGANSLMLWTVMGWCEENGVEIFHLGGGVTEGDGLERFKRSFASRRLDFHTGRFVVDPGRYEALTRRRAAKLGTTVEALDATGFFPAFLAEV